LCGSASTRPSTTRDGPIALFSKGSLYRCRECKLHFRIGDDNPTILWMGGAGALALLGLLVFVAIHSGGYQIASIFSTFESSLPFKIGRSKVVCEPAEPYAPTGPQ